MVKRRQEGSSADSGAKSSDEATDYAHSSKEKKRRKLSSTRSLDPLSETTDLKMGECCVRPLYESLKEGDEDDTESSSTEGDLSSSSQQFYEEMVGAVLEMQDSHGRIICELFKRLPPKDLYPEYYAVIKEPIDLKMISTRVRSSYYSTIEDWKRIFRYIEGLRDGNPHMSNWTQSRKPDAATMTPQQLAQLPVHWLGNSYGDFDNPVDALWALKEHMMKDALSLSRFGEP
ncbi:predicted protein [Nematostella vectensis]|uniref:Bromo domain-containing protein n=1 Tax=Nematostella vectensis TaxID=45351 RepID=A7T2A2_NEMVE|nr:predicted protein [Nematostella vectensis]|eukprot:XP_001622014.1 hypothetical protein NEMVEDRAFT_v1g221284 [Nematostella vectensis]